MKFHEVVRQLQSSPSTPLWQKRSFEANDDRGTKYIATTSKGSLVITHGIDEQRPIKMDATNILLELDWQEVSTSIHWTDAIRYWMSGDYVIACQLDGDDYWFDDMELISTCSQNITLKMLEEGKWYAKKRRDGEDEI